MNKKQWILVGVVGVIALGFIAGFIINYQLNKFSPLSGVPSTTAVSGNGGSAVMAGEYLYFVGGYVDVTTIKYKQNEYNKVDEGAIYRVRLTDGKPVYDNTKYNHDLYDSDINTWVRDKDLEKVVPKIAGYEKTALWIFGDHLIYTSPNNTLDRTGKLQTSRVDFFRADLNGDNHERIYTTASAEVAKGSFTAVSINGKSYLLVNDGGKLVRVGISDGLGDVDVISSAATSFAFPIVSSYGGDITSLENSYTTNGEIGIMSYVFYTEELDEDDAQNGNVLKRYRIDNGDNSEVSKVHRKVFKANSLSNGRLFLEVGDWETGNTVGKDNILYIVTNPLRTEFAPDQIKKYQAIDVYDSSETFYASSESAGSAAFKFISHFSNTILLYEKIMTDSNGNNYAYRVGADLRALPLATDVSEIISVNASMIYYKTTNNEVKAVDYSGEQRFATYVPQSMVEGSAASAFYNLKSSWAGMVFYVRTFSDLDDDGNEHKTTAAVMVDSNGNDYVLGQIEDTYLTERVDEEAAAAGADAEGAGN